MTIRPPAALSYAFAALCPLAATLPGTAFAQAADAPDSAGQARPVALSEQIEIVTVTAQKRKEDPNKVAMSISAISGAQLQAQHVNDITDLTRTVPNISFTAATGNGGAGPGTSNIEIRGISSGAGAATVGIYLGDVSLTVGNVYTMGAVEPKFFDIDRVEVLRGPQATLYGASSMGGTIKFVPNEPDLAEREFSTYAEASSLEGGSAGYLANAVANIPLVRDELALRIGVQAQRAGGFIDQVGNGGSVLAGNINKVDDQEVRIALKWKPTAALTVTPSVYYQKVDARDIAAFNIELPRYQAQKQVREPSKDILQTANVLVGWDLGAADLTSSTSHFRRKFDRTQNGSAYNSYSLSTFLTSTEDGGTAPPELIEAVAALPSAVYLNNRVRQLAQELRLASKPYDPARSPLTWLGGLYVSKQHTDINENDPIFGVNDTFAQFGFSSSDPDILPGANAGSFPGDNAFSGTFHYTERQSSVFGELNYYFTPSLHATVGARYLKGSSSLDQRNSLYLAGAGNTGSSRLSSTAFLPKYALTWEVDPAHTVYTTAAKGFRLGGSNVFVPPTTCAPDLEANGLEQGPATYAPDSLWSYEVGSKSRFLNNRLSINADVFYVKWTNIQQGVYLPTCAYTYNANAGDAVSKGVEFDIKARPFAGLTLSASGGYVKAELSNDEGIRNGVIGAVQGAQVQGVPKYNAAVSAQYNFAAFGDRSAFVAGGVQWVGSSKGSLNPEQTDYQRPAYHTVDLSAGLTLDRYKLSLFVKNALDDDTIIQHPQVASIVQGYRLMPRSIGMSVAARF
ncbi:TonB-dependent receptor [Massilia dura]|uniref:TonB-dependent receptor n=1 Tax=Pseudoduganella dura TaxID=321982 RepID=A0A6I3XGR2_9BURK|nr:TonB-dependent receptor [Pseudoduganella dura]MUI12831.1 TonB-dependent receptor [Pseudoduganella dura]GGX92904.1 TonB-dependent receptor [Pseudoduganella dura]